MALADMMKRGFLTSATATPATPATHEAIDGPTVATVATVAVAKTWKISSSMPTVATVAGVAVAKPPKMKMAFNAGSLEQWQFDLVREFIEADGLTAQEAQELAAASVRPRPPDEWLALIADLDDLIGRYCAAARLDDGALAAMLATRRSQSPAAIPAAVAWFRAEVDRMARESAPAAPAPRQAREMNYAGRARGRTEREALTVAGTGRKPMNASGGR